MEHVRWMMVGVMGLASCTQLMAPAELQPEPTRDAMTWPDFPAERDLSILLPLEREAFVKADTELAYGVPALPEAWVDQVGRAYEPTVVEDGFADESWYEDWRLVSVRVVPCGPMAASPSIAPASVCWPVVRSVWQPVVNFMERGGVKIDAWADDRAIHAVYPVRPRDAYGQRVDGAALDAFAQQLKAGVPTRSLPPEVAAQRDATVSWLLDEVAYLRDPSLPVGSWSGFDIRPELMGSWELASPFHTRLLDFLTETTQPTDLRELTSFSLPAGRSPSGDDAWVFVQFFGAEGVLTQQSLEVVSRRDGRLLLDYGFAQDAGQTTESPEVEAALAADPYGELHETVVSSTTEIGKVRDLILRPDELFVPNTTCATCHRLNELRFNFHSLSHFEDEDHTVSPRVEADVAYELAWTRSWMGGWE